MDNKIVAAWAALDRSNDKLISVWVGMVPDERHRGIDKLYHVPCTITYAVPEVQPPIPPWALRKAFRVVK